VPQAIQPKVNIWPVKNPDTYLYFCWFIFVVWHGQNNFNVLVTACFVWLIENNLGLFGSFCSFGTFAATIYPSGRQQGLRGEPPTGGKTSQPQSNIRRSNKRPGQPGR